MSFTHEISATRITKPRLLQRRRFVELTKGKAVIEAANSAVAYRPYNKPALRPLGDSLRGFVPGAEAIAVDEAKVTTSLHPRAHLGAP